MFQTVMISFIFFMAFNILVMTFKNGRKSFNLSILSILIAIFACISGIGMVIDNQILINVGYYTSTILVAFLALDTFKKFKARKG